MQAPRLSNDAEFCEVLRGNGRYPGLVPHEGLFRSKIKSTPVAEALAARDIPFVFATGGSDDSVDAQFRDRPVLQKPFTMDGVAKALAAL